MSAAWFAKGSTLVGAMVVVCMLGHAHGAQVLSGKFTKELNSPSAGVPGVRVTGDGGEDKISDSFGRFQMTFSTMEPGDEVRLSFLYKDWELVNGFVLPHTLKRARSELQLWIAPKSEVMAKRQFYLQDSSLKAIKRESDVKTVEVRKKVRQGQYSENEGARQIENINRERDRKSAITIEMAKDLSRIPPEAQDRHVRKAMQDVANGQPDRALSTMRERPLGMITTGPGGAETLVFHSQLLQLDGRQAEAETLLRQAATRAPESASIKQSAAEFYQRTNRPVLAKEKLTEALDIAQRSTASPQAAAILARLGVLSKQQNRFDEGRQYFTQSLSLLEPFARTAGIDSKRDLAVVYDQLGQLELASNRRDDAAVAWNKSLNIYGDLQQQNLLLDPAPANGVRLKLAKIARP